MAREDCLAEGRKQFARIQQDPHGHSGAWVSAIYFFVAGGSHFPEGLNVLQYAIDRKKPGDMNHILSDKPMENIRTRNALRNRAAIIPEILLAFKKALDKEELPLTETGLRKPFLAACFHISILEEKFVYDPVLPYGSIPKSHDAKKQLREMKRDAKILATYFIAHPGILNDALTLRLKNEKPSDFEDPDEAEGSAEE